MSDDNKDLPIGIRNNNPGNLRTRIGDKGVIAAKNGFGQYRTMLDGTIALAEEVHTFYTVHGLRTVRDFLARYAPPSENDLMAYENFVCSRMRIEIKKAATEDMRLDLAWRSIDLMRAITLQENGFPKAQHSIGGEWIAPETYIAAIRLVGIWGRI